jgi:hypothetical protein
VVLTPDPEDESPNESLEVAHYVMGQKYGLAREAVDSEFLGKEADEIVAKLRLLAGNCLEGSMRERRAWGTIQPLEPPCYGVARFDVLDPDLGIIQLLQPNTPPINVRVPTSHHPRYQGCRLVVTLQPDGLLSIDIELKNPMANVLLQYYEGGFFGEAASIATSPNLSAERLLAGKMNDPIAATIAAYTLLRLGDLDRLHDWTRNLRDWFSWLPDGIPIRAEHLARLGEHERALLTLLDLPSRGLPVFSDGLSHAINRLRVYANLPLDKSPFAGTELFSSGQALLKQLQRFAAFADFQKLILFFTGTKPHEPDDEPFDGDLESHSGLDVAPHLG